MSSRIATIVSSLVIYAIGVGVFLAALLTDYWVVVHDFANIGLFKFCGSSSNVCQDLGWNFNEGGLLSVYIPRILMLVTAGFALIGFLVFIIGFKTKSFGAILSGGIFYIIAGVIVFAACGVLIGGYSAEFAGIGGITDSVVFTFHYSFYMGWVCGCLFVISGVLAVVGAKAFSWGGRQS